MSAIQQNVPKDMLGRIMSFYSAIVSIALPIGILFYGYLYEKFIDHLPVIMFFYRNHKSGLPSWMLSSSDCMRITFPASSPTSVSSNCPVTMNWNRPTLQTLSNIFGKKSRNRKSRKSMSDSLLRRSGSTPICSSLTPLFSGSSWIKFISPRFTRQTRTSRVLRSEKLRSSTTSLVHLILRKQGSNPKQPKKKRKPA